MIFFSRIHSLVRKEFQSLLSTKSGRMLLVMPVILQTALFPFAATLEVKNASLAVFNEDHGRASVEMMQRFAASGAFTRIIPVWSGRASRPGHRHPPGTARRAHPGGFLA